MEYQHLPVFGIKITKALLYTFSMLVGIATYADPSKLKTSHIDLSGSYQCSGYDRHDGPITGIIHYTLDEDASDFKHNFSAYTYQSSLYKGFIAVQGAKYAYYFENKNPHLSSDRGVGIASITYDQNEQGTFTKSMHSSYYQPNYKRNTKDNYGTGGYGTAVCVKLN